MVLFFCPTGIEDVNATVRWTVAADGLTEANLDFSFQQKEKCSKSGRYCVLIVLIINV